MTYPIARVGILGGGQLGRMLIYEAQRLGIETVVLDPAGDAPCARLADRFIQGPLDDDDAIRRLASQSDVVTWEIEHVGVPTLEALEAEGVRIQPSPKVLRIIQDKLAQKRFLENLGLPVPRFAPASQADDFHAFGYPCVQKTRFGGYDGRGVLVLEDETAVQGALLGSSMVEEKVDIATELAVVVARSADGTAAVFPVVEMVFAGGANICSMVTCPADIPEAARTAATRVALEAVAALDATGVVAVELFLSTKGEILINEIAPRPHNSGHLTIEACRVSQFEQHLRAILGLPLGDPSLLSPAAMVNILGDEGRYAGSPLISGLRESLAVPGASVHFYGKREARPNRKMGHVTVTADTIGEAVARAATVQRLLRISAQGS